jgi:hypothetical protein
MQLTDMSREELIALCEKIENALVERTEELSSMTEFRDKAEDNAEMYKRLKSDIESERDAILQEKNALQEQLVKLKNIQSRVRLNIGTCGT